MSLSKEGTQDSFPLQQKILVCSLLLLTRQLKIKEVTLGKVSGESQQMELGWRQECFVEQILSKGPIIMLQLIGIKSGF